MIDEIIRWDNEIIEITLHLPTSILDHSTVVDFLINLGRLECLNKIHIKLLDPRYRQIEYVQRDLTL